MAEKQTASEEQTTEMQKIWTKQDVADFLDEINKTLVSSNSANLHSLLGLNRLMTIDNVGELFDEDLKAQAKDIWVKLKSTGVQLSDPPFMFGAPKLEQRSSEVDTSDVIIYADDDDETPSEEPVVEKKSTRSAKNADKLPQ